MNPIQTCKVPEGFKRETKGHQGPCLFCPATNVTISWNDNFEAMGGIGPFRAEGRTKKKINRWFIDLEDAVEMAAPND